MNATIEKTKNTMLSQKTQKWCRRIASIAAKRAFRVKMWQRIADKFDPEQIDFYLLPKIYHRKRISHTNCGNKIFLLPEFFDEKGNIRKKLPKELREELKAAIFKEVVHFAVKRSNTEFYKIMLRCTWKGTRVDGALNSETEARKILDEKKKAKKIRHKPLTEIPTGITEDIEMLDLRSGQKVLVKDAQIFLTDKGSIKIARGVYEGRNLRAMLSGGKALREKLGL